MIGNLHKEYFPLEQEQKALMRLIGAGGYPRRGRYQQDLEAQTARFCARAGCTRAMEREIWEMVHEDMHAEQGWYRIFPRLDAGAMQRQGLEKYASSMTPLDKLMKGWLARGWEPRHSHDRNGSVHVSREQGRVLDPARRDARRGNNEYWLRGRGRTSTGRGRH